MTMCPEIGGYARFDDRPRLTVTAVDDFEVTGKGDDAAGSRGTTSVIA